MTIIWEPDGDELLSFIRSSDGLVTGGVWWEESSGSWYWIVEVESVHHVCDGNAPTEDEAKTAAVAEIAEVFS